MCRYRCFSVAGESVREWKRRVQEKSARKREREKRERRGREEREQIPVHSARDNRSGNVTILSSSFGERHFSLPEQCVRASAIFPFLWYSEPPGEKTYFRSRDFTSKTQMLYTKCHDSLTRILTRTLPSLFLSLSLFSYRATIGSVTLYYDSLT